MDAMHAAIKSRRSKPGLMEGGDAEAPVKPDGAVSDLAGLVAKLSPEQKAELMSLLSEGEGHGEETPGSLVAKGAPSSEEKGKIAAKMSEEGGGYDEETSDDIQMSMIDRRHMDAPEDMKPKGLGDRARLAAAQRLKAKGKA